MCCALSKKKKLNVVNFGSIFCGKAGSDTIRAQKIVYLFWVSKAQFGIRFVCVTLLVDFILRTATLYTIVYLFCAMCFVAFSGNWSVVLMVVCVVVFVFSLRKYNKVTGTRKHLLKVGLRTSSAFGVYNVSNVTHGAFQHFVNRAGCKMQPSLGLLWTFPLKANWYILLVLMSSQLNF